MSYLDKLVHSAEKYGSVVCLGLDPQIEAFPLPFKAKGIEGFPEFLEVLTQKLSEKNLLPGAFKLNQGFFLCHDEMLTGRMDGSRALADSINYLRASFPDIPIILDYKRGDISTSSANYAREGFISWGADAVTVSSYMGSDSVLPFLRYCNVEEKRGVYLLNRNSNKGASDFQNLPVVSDGVTAPLYLKVAEKIVEWASGRPGTGAVVGATSPEELEQLASFYAESEIPLLIPGVGAQGGTGEEVIAILKKSRYDLRLIRVNSSSGITHPWQKQNLEAPKDWLDISTAEMEKLKNLLL